MEVKELLGSIVLAIGYILGFMYQYVMMTYFVILGLFVVVNNLTSICTSVMGSLYGDSFKILMRIFSGFYTYYIIFGISVKIVLDYFNVLMDIAKPGILKDKLKEKTITLLESRFQLIFLIVFEVIMAFYLVKVGISFVFTISFSATCFLLFFIVLSQWIMVIKSMFRKSKETEIEFQEIDENPEEHDSQNEKQKENLLWNIFDPIEIHKMEELSLFSNDPQCNSFLEWRTINTHKIFGIISLICSIIFKESSSSIIEILIFSPLTMILNFSILFQKKANLENKRNIKFINMFISILLFLMVISSIILSIIVLFILIPNNHTFSYTSISQTSNQSHSFIPSSCYLGNPYAIPMINISSLPLFPFFLKKDPNNKTIIKSEYFESFNSVFKQIFGMNYENSSFEFVQISDSYPSSILFDRKSNITYIILSGINTKYQLSLFFETYILNTLPGYLENFIPFLSVINSQSEKEQNFLYYVSLTFGKTYIINEIDKIASFLSTQKLFNPIIVGQSIGGYIAQSLIGNDYFKFHMPYLITFDSLDTHYQSGTQFEKEEPRYHISIQTKDSVITDNLGDSDEIISYPNIKSYIHPINVYDSFCTTVARCSTSDNLVYLCNQMLSQHSRNGTSEYELLVENTDLSKN